MMRYCRDMELGILWVKQSEVPVKPWSWRLLVDGGATGIACGDRTHEDEWRMGRIANILVG